MQYDEFRAMNSQILLAAEGEPQQVSRGFQATREYIAACERRFTRFSDDSELAQINRTVGGWFIASDDLFEVVQVARTYVEQTCGLFDPSILPVLRQAGYDRSMDELRAQGALPAPTGASAVLPWAAGGFQGVQMSPMIHGIHLPEGVQIDLGGIAKGWIAERAAHLLAAYTSACTVSAGGDMFLFNAPADETAWPVSLEDPRDPANVLAILRVRQGAVATSAITKRRWVQGERVQHHIIDPRTGVPAVTDWLSVTVIAPHAAQAEVFAKALLIAGTEQSPALAERAGGITFIGVKQDGSLWGSANSEEYLDVSTQTV